MTRSTFTTLLLGLLLTAWGCSLFADTDRPPTVLLVLDQDFDHDWVVAEVAGRRVLADTLVSSAYRRPEICCAPAASVQVPLPAGRQRLRVRVNDAVEGTFEFDASRWRSIGIRYDRSERRLIFVPSEKIEVYEG